LLKYVFPVSPGGIARGVLTASSSIILKNNIMLSDDNFVWPYEKGENRGQSIKPLYKTVPSVVSKNKDLYFALVVVDLIRIGKTRDLKVAKKELEKWLKI
jgi:hypothetical protein